MEADAPTASAVAMASNFCEKRMCKSLKVSSQIGGEGERPSLFLVLRECSRFVIAVL